MQLELHVKEKDFSIHFMFEKTYYVESSTNMLRSTYKIKGVVDMGNYLKITKKAPYVNVSEMIRDKLKIEGDYLSGSERKTFERKWNRCMKELGIDSYKDEFKNSSARSSRYHFLEDDMTFLQKLIEMLVSYDIVSSQMFILACLAGEDSLIQRYQSGSDIYLCIASTMTGRQESKITVEERNIYKKFILEMIYGAGIQTLYREMQSAGYQTSFAGIKAMKKRFFEAYPAIREYCRFVKKADYVLLPAGRKWFVKEIEPYRRCAYIMQFVESLILRKTLILLKGYAKRGWFDLYMTIHDSIWLEVNIRFYKLVQKLIQECFDKSVYSVLKLQELRLKEELIYEF